MTHYSLYSNGSICWLQNQNQILPEHEWEEKVNKDLKTNNHIECKKHIVSFVRSTYIIIIRQ